MIARLFVLLLIVTLALAPTGMAVQQPPTDPDLEEGIRQVRKGHFAGGVITLDGVARRLAAEGGHSQELARAFTYLSIAYLRLAQEQKATAQFLEALKTDPDLLLDESEFPPWALQFFEDTRKEAQEEATVGPAAPAEDMKKEDPVVEATTTATESTPMATEPASAEPEKKGGSKKTLLVLLGAGAGAAGVGVALAGGGGGSSTAPSTPTEQGCGGNFTVSAHDNSVVSVLLNTGLDIVVGTRLLVTAMGNACYGGDPPLCSGPDGDPEEGSRLRPNGCETGELVGRLGDGPLICLGVRFDGAAPAGGPLSLGYNDIDFANNSGSYSVDVVGTCRS